MDMNPYNSNMDGGNPQLTSPNIQRDFIGINGTLMKEPIHTTNHILDYKENVDKNNNIMKHPYSTLENKEEGPQTDYFVLNEYHHSNNELINTKEQIVLTSLENNETTNKYNHMDSEHFQRNKNHMFYKKRQKKFNKRKNREFQDMMINYYKKGKYNNNNNNNTLCSICLANEKKYKFPCCYEYYCSLGCYNQHNKEECISKQKNTKRKYENKGHEKNNNNNENIKTSHEDLDTQQNSVEKNKKKYEENFNKKNDSNNQCLEQFLTEEQKNKLKNNLTLRVLLKNNYIRSIFKNFTLMNDKLTYLSYYINDPAVIQIIEQIMKSVEE